MLYICGEALAEGGASQGISAQPVVPKISGTSNSTSPGLEMQTHRSLTEAASLPSPSPKADGTQMMKQETVMPRDEGGITHLSLGPGEGTGNLG